MVGPNSRGIRARLNATVCFYFSNGFGARKECRPPGIGGKIEKAIENLVSLVNKNGRLYISFPIGKKNEVHFNAHRVFHPTFILENSIIKKYMRLLRFDYVDDNGDIHFDTTVSEVKNDIKFGCGIYTFIKI